ncbi:MAG: hypothetical protein U0326_37520 [Polyangiales bacterium]
MRAKVVIASLLVVAGVAQVALAQHRGDASSDGTAGVSSSGVAASGARARTAPTAPPGTAPVAASVSQPVMTPAAPTANDAPRDAAADAPRTPRDACDEVLHAVQFEDVDGATRAYATCRARVAVAGRIPVADDIRTLEDVTESLHGLRREDGTFCVEPAAPFDLRGVVGGAADTRACFASLDRFLSSDNAVWRFAMADPYASGRLAARASFDMVTARRLRRRPAQGTPAERELLAIARLAGRHFMRACRCLPGPQPDSVTAVRAMHLPSTVESVLLRGLEEREGTPAEP